MIEPTTKADVMDLMRKSHDEFHDVLSRIPEDRMSEIALYDNWSIKDLIAHVGAWQLSLSERIAALRANETPENVGLHDIDETNAMFHAKYRDTPLDEVKTIEAASFTALERQVEALTEAELFEVNHFSAYPHALIQPIAGDTYDHYPEHLDDVRAWMRQNGLD